MTRVAVKTKYESASQAASGTLTVGAGELKLKASCSDSTFLKGVSLHGVSLGIEKPGAFLIDYDLQQQVWCLSCFSTSSASTSSPTFCFHIGFSLYCDFRFSSWNLCGRHGVWLWYSAFGKLSTNLDVCNHFCALLMMREYEISVIVTWCGLQAFHGEVWNIILSPVD
jgi:hypothetical protein